MSRKTARRPSKADNKVIIATLHPGTVTTDYTRSLIMLALENPKQSIIGFNTTRTSRSFSGRNQAIERFLSQPGDWLLWIDSDMVFQPEDYEVLYQEAMTNPEAKIVTGLCFMWDETRQIIMPNIFNWNDEVKDYRATPHYRPNSRFWCDATGVAFTLIHREVFEKIGYPWHRDWIKHPDTGQIMGHDLSFYHEARKHGYRVRYCADARIGHVKNWTITEQSFYQQLQLHQQAEKALDQLEQQAT